MDDLEGVYRKIPSHTPIYSGEPSTTDSFWRNLHTETPFMCPIPDTVENCEEANSSVTPHSPNLEEMDLINTSVIVEREKGITSNTVLSDFDPLNCYFQREGNYTPATEALPGLNLTEVNKEEYFNVVREPETKGGRRQESTIGRVLKEGTGFSPDTPEYKVVQDDNSKSWGVGGYRTLHSVNGYDGELLYPRNVDGTTSQAVRSMSAKERETVLQNRKIRNRASARRSHLKRLSKAEELGAEVVEIAISSISVLEKCNQTFAQNKNYLQSIRKMEFEIDLLKSKQRREDNFIPPSFT